MSTRLGLSFRAIDRFALPGNDQGNTDHKPSRLSYVQGSPRFNSSGLLAALSLSKYVPSPPEDLSPETISKDESRIRDSQSSIRNYFISDLETLNWLNERQGGDPLMAVTTEQSYKTHHSLTPQTTIELKPLSEELTLDYPLCTIASKTDSEEDIGAAKAVRDFLTSKEFQEMATSFAFAPAVNQKSHPQLGATARALLASWPKMRRPAMTVFVLDGSIKTDRPTMETIRREIKLFIESRPSPDDAVALVSASTNPAILSAPQTSTESLNNALNKISTSGGNAIRDGIQTAFTIFTDLTSLNYRRSVIVFTSGKDVASQTSITRLTNRASQLVGRKGVDLFVIGFGAATADFGELPALTKDVGGTFIRTTNATFPADFFPIARRVQ
jgi:Mg-chelatase subunit ChlD